MAAVLAGFGGGGPLARGLFGLLRLQTLPRLLALAAFLFDLLFFSQLPNPKIHVLTQTIGKSILDLNKGIFGVMGLTGDSVYKDAIFLNLRP